VGITKPPENGAVVKKPWVVKTTGKPGDGESTIGTTSPYTCILDQLLNGGSRRGSNHRELSVEGCAGPRSISTDGDPDTLVCAVSNVENERSGILSFSKETYVSLWSGMCCTTLQGLIYQ
jgi:hypothetical protein